MPDAPSLPQGLTEELRRREARIERWWAEDRRIYVRARAPDGRLFARASRDPGDREVLRFEAAVREVVGRAGPLRAPAVLARGPDWMVEVEIRGEPWTGAAAMTAIVSAGEMLAGLRLPERTAPPPRLPRAEGLRRRLRLLSSPLPIAHVLRARRIVRDPRLPTVTGHGDFHPGNVFLSDGAAWVVDWELAGPRPAGFDLLQFWASLPEPPDRERLFAAIVDLVGPRHRPELLRLRYALAVRTAANKLTASLRGGPDRDDASRLVGLLPELGAEAGRS